MYLTSNNFLYFSLIEGNNSKLLIMLNRINQTLNCLLIMLNRINQTFHVISEELQMLICLLVFINADNQLCNQIIHLLVDGFKYADFLDYLLDEPTIVMKRS